VPSLGRKLFIDAQAWIKVPFTLKWSCDRSRFARGMASTALRKAAATLPSSRRFLEKVEASHTASSMPSPTNQRNRRLKSSCSISWRSERTE